MNRLHDAEFSVMRGLWMCDTPITTSNLKEYLEKERRWNMSALQTILSRLEAKGFIRSEMKKHTKFYEPLVSRAEYMKEEGITFFDRFGADSLTGLVSGLYDSRSITDSDLEELMTYIRSKTEKK